MADFFQCDIDEQGEVRPFVAHGQAVLADAGAVSVMRGTFEPGWRWSRDVGPLAGTATCQVRHQGFVISGAMTVRFEDGSEMHMEGGDVVDIPAGHDAWVTGEEPCVFLDVSPEATRYAVGRPSDIAPPENSQMALVRRGYDAFNAGDVETLLSLFAADVVQHVPGDGPLAGTYKGPEAVLGYYGRVAEMTGGTFRAHLVDLHGDGHGHVLAVHQTSGVRDGRKRVSWGAILFSVVGDKIHDLLEMHGDLPGDDAWMS